MQRNVLRIDTSELNGVMNRLRTLLTPEQYKRLMYRVFSRAAGTVRKHIDRNVRQEYDVPQAYVRSAFRPPIIKAGAEVQCTIPLRGARGTVGGRYSARGGARGWNALRYRGRGYRISFSVVRGTRSELPQTMRHQSSGNKPFRNLSARSLNGVAFVRKGKDRLPIVRIASLGVPQMPINRAGPAIQRDTLNTIQQRLEHEFLRMMEKPNG